MQIAVRRGDSLWKYSQLFHMPLQLLIDSNRSIDTQSLQIGQSLQIPGYYAQSYVVKPGDSLWAIASRYQVGLEQLAHINGHSGNTMLQVGETLVLPMRVEQLVAGTSRSYTSSVLKEEVARLVQVYPFIAQETIGSSVMGKPIISLKIGNGNKQVHANASIHANEWITTPILLRFLNEYARALTLGMPVQGLPALPLYLSTKLLAVPMLNPDGVDLVIEGPPEEEPYRSSVLDINGGSHQFSGWKANIRGVDLNKQFPALWERDAVKGPQAPAPRDYSGTAPLTEPEVQALAKFTENHDFAHVLAFHTQGKVIYWGFEQFEPPYAKQIAEEFARVSGYEAIQNVDSTAGYKDWFIMKWRKPGFTIEFGSGVNPLPLEQFDEIYGAALGIMLAALYE